MRQPGDCCTATAGDVQITFSSIDQRKRTPVSGVLTLSLTHVKTFEPLVNVVDGETGILVPVDAAAELSAALQKLIADSVARREMGSAGLVRARQRNDEANIIRRQLEHLGLLSSA